MTYMKLVLLSSAAGIVAVASAQAADLPTRKAAPAEYVKICNVGGMAGFIIPGSDTCLKIGGYITAQIEAGNTTKGYTWAPVAGGPAGSHSGSALVSTPASLHPDFGFTTRANISLDARQNTSYGVLRGYVELQVENGNGFDTDGTGSYINLAYVQWAGITAGKAPSFFSFFGGGEGWANIFSPDQQGFNQPDVLAYTATFGGGFSATIAIQSQGPNSFSATGLTNNSSSGGGTNQNVDTTNYGQSTPDIVANVRVDQSWGSAQLSGVVHQVHVYEAGATPGPGVATFSENKWGWAIDGGVKFNLPSFGAGDNVQLQGVYSKNAFWYSGIPDGMWGENGAVNGNGLAMTAGDTYFAGTDAAGNAVWSTPTAWSIGGTFEHHFSPVFSIDPQASYAQLHWSGSLGELSSNSESWIVGAVAHWDPVPLLDFSFELMYQNTHQSTPLNWGTTGTIDGVASSFKNNTDGVAGRFYITRNF
ncbi:porin [Methylocapsa sp. S129]|uniref:porin n=1 Tax=Methylocapsa sp. S129 TaxID=1641869 RepID=UPI00131CF61B|nr:porin [Methylocapsa sp. S129]